MWNAASERAELGQSLNTAATPEVETGMRMRRPGMRSVARVGLVGCLTAAIGIGLAGGALAQDAGYKTVTVKRPGLTLQIPDTWKTVHLTKKALAALEAKLTPTNPGAALNTQGQAQLLKAVSLYAGSFDAAIAGQPLSFVTVQPKVISVHPVNVNEFSASTRAELAPKGFTVLDTTETTYGGKPAYRVDYTYPNAAGGVTLIGQLLIPDGKGSDEVVVSTTADDAGTALVNAILGSVKPKH
jgi:hypothetical protein